MRSGLQRRFGYYVAEHAARMIVWPREIDEKQINNLADLFSPLADLEGKFFLSDGAFQVWHGIQLENRRLLDAICGVDEASEARRHALGESPSRILKLAAIFQTCRWAKSKSGSAFRVEADTLLIAAEHQASCIDAARELETIGKRAEIDDEAERILAVIRCDAKLEEKWEVSESEIRITKTDLTRKFAANTGRGGLSPHRLHKELMPRLISKEEARITEARGSVVYYIKRELE